MCTEYVISVIENFGLLYCRYILASPQTHFQAGTVLSLCVSWAIMERSTLFEAMRIGKLATSCQVNVLILVNPLI